MRKPTQYYVLSTVSTLIPSILGLLCRKLFLTTVDRTINRLQTSSAELAAEDAHSFFACAFSLEVLCACACSTVYVHVGPASESKDELEDAENRWVRWSSSTSASIHDRIPTTQSWCFDDVSATVHFGGCFAWLMSEDH